MGDKKHIRADFVPGHYQFTTDKGSVRVGLIFSTGGQENSCHHIAA